VHATAKIDGVMLNEGGFFTDLDSAFDKTRTLMSTAVSRPIGESVAAKPSPMCIANEKGYS
jgi:hypothetical protein